jgi:hypothetical protein
MRTITKEQARIEHDSRQEAAYRQRLQGAVKFWQDDYAHKDKCTNELLIIPRAPSDETVALQRKLEQEPDNAELAIEIHRRISDDFQGGRMLSKPNSGRFTRVPPGGLTREDYAAVLAIDPETATNDQMAAALAPFTPHMARLDLHRVAGHLHVVRDWVRDETVNGKVRKAGRHRLGAQHSHKVSGVEGVDHEKLHARYLELVAVDANPQSTVEQKRAAHDELDKMARATAEVLEPLHEHKEEVGNHTHRAYPMHAGRVHEEHRPRSFTDADFSCGTCGKSPDRMIEVSPGKFVCADCLKALA